MIILIWRKNVFYNFDYTISCCSMKLKLLVRDSKLQEKQALTEAFQLTQHGCVAFIGPASSGPTAVVSDFLSISPLDRALVGYSATSPQLSDFANFLRTPPSDDVQATLMATLMKGMLVSPTCLSHGLRFCLQRCG